MIVGENPPIELPMTKDEFCSLVGEGLHTGLRKGSGAPSADGLWRAISQSADGAWSDALDYMAWGFEFMGIFKFKNEDPSPSGAP